MAGLALAGAARAADMPQDVVIGVLTIRSPEQTRATWQPTADYLSRMVPGSRFRVEALDATQFDAAMAQNRIDFILTNPGHYVFLESRYRITRIATLVKAWEGYPLKSFGGVVVVRADRSDLQRLEDLRDKRIAAVGADWLGAYQAQAGELLAAGIDLREDRRLTFTGEPQDRAVVEVLEKRADAGFVRTGLLEEMQREGKIETGALRVLAPRHEAGFPFQLSTRLYPEWPLAVAPRTPGELASRVAVALLSMQPGSLAAYRGSYHGWTIPADYLPVRELMKSLRLPPYDSRPQFSLRDVIRRYDAMLFAGLGLALLLCLLAIVRFRMLNRMVTQQMEVISAHSGKLESEIAARREAEEGLRLSASVFENSNDGIVITNHDNVIVDVNRAFSTITGYSRDEVLGKNPSILKSGRQDADFYRELWHALGETGHWCGEMWNRRKDGDCYVELLDITAVKNRRGEVAHYVAIFSDVTDMRKSQERLKLMAHYDPLTHLPNRVLLADRLNQAVAQAKRDDHLLAVCFVDLDGFKPINDDYGHEIGDQLLIEVARRMLDALRAIDTVARLGGDEFVLLLTGLADMQELDMILTRVMEGIATPVVIEGLELMVTASIGMTLFPLDDADPESLLRHADQAMYMAKRDGRNRYTLFDSNQDKEAQSRIHRNERVRQALKNGEFVLHYQPKVDMRAGRVVGLEALIRWQHPERGLIFPGEFLPHVEHGELIADIDDWVIGSVLRQIESWVDGGLTISVSVNLSARKLQSADFVLRIAQLLAQYPRAAPQLLEFEILESAALGDLEGVRHTIRACQELGTQFALDDFGTGYSSLSYLKRLPIDTIKIDQSFVRDLLDNSEDLAIVEGIVGLGKVFQRRTVGEGVESPEHGVMLMRLGCDLAQGYGIARPMPAADVPAWCREFRPNPQWAVWANVRWNIEDFPLLVAQSDHVKWVKGIARLAAGGIAGLSQDEVSDYHHCRFGRWYYGGGQARYGGIAEFVAIEPVHAEIHRIGTEIVRRVEAGDEPAARSHLPRLFELREEVRAHLTALQRAVVERW